MDFFQIVLSEKKGILEASADFLVKRTEDLMVRAKNFYAIWDEDAGLWSTDEYDVQRIVDSYLKAFVDKNPHVGKVKYMRNFSSNGQSTFRKYMSQIGDNSHQLDETLTFRSQKVERKDYVSKRLPYDLAPGDHSAWDDMVGKLYKPAELEKIEWFIGSIVSGDSRKNQKFLVLHGPPGAGKGTVIDIILMLFDGYTTTFDAKALWSNGNQFAAAAFGGNPLVAIQHDGDLSRIEDNTLLNSIVSHEVMKVNEKYKPAYDTKLIAALIMGTNKPVKITDAQSGLIRRLIDVHPSGERHTPQAYHAIKDRVPFQLGAIAQHCLDVYQKLGKNYYSNYRPTEMMFKTNAFFNYIEANYDIFERQNGISAKQAWNLFKEYQEEANLQTKMTYYAFKAELGNYFEDYHDRIVLDGVTVRSYYEGFKAEPFKTPVDDDVKKFTLIMDETTSLLDLEFADYAAQYATESGTPQRKWENVKTTLAEIDTTREHYVMGFPMNHIVLDFDLKDADGNKSLEANLEAAAGFPATYAELSKSGEGVHLHYLYDGDVLQLDREFLPGIEIKVFAGNSALRRRLSRCNNVPISSLAGGLPLKEKKRVLDPGVMNSEKGLRALIAKNLRKEIHPGTKPSIDFIKHVLDEAYDAGWAYDVTNMRQAVTAFANSSTNKPLECLLTVQSMKWKSADNEIVEEAKPVEVADEREVLFDVECYPNLFLICWKFADEPGVAPDPKTVNVMLNPKPHEVESLFRLKLVGFNVRNYDNHMLWAAALGFNNEQLHTLSQRIINGAPGSKFGEAYNLSWTDIYDYSSVKQGLKKWQIVLHLPHKEMDIAWDKPVPEDRIQDVIDYCINDVISEEYVHRHRAGDYKARQILATLSGLTVNDTTAKHTATIVFGRDKNPQRSFVYTDLTKEFPGYVFEGGKSTYRGETVGEGGYVYAEPGLHRDVALLDVASMHPTSIGQLNLFGEYTPRFMALVEAQLAIKNGRYDDAKTFFEGKLTPYIEEIEHLRETDPAAAKKAAGDLRWGLKIAINIVYGLTSAKFDNPFRDIRNADNIVAKRGALFMIDLKHYVQDLGYQVVHIKTDSIKIPGATPEIIEQVTNFGAKYGYTFEHEADYAKLGLVNDAVYVAKKDECITNCWSATGSQYLHPYVFKKLFGYEDDISALDLGETKHVQQGALYLDFGHHHTDHEYMGYVIEAQDEIKAMKKVLKEPSVEQMDAIIGEAVDKLIFVGKTGRFMPVQDGYGGGQLWRIKDGKPYAVQGTKGYLWVDSEIGMNLPDDAIDYGYFDGLVNDARANLEKFVEGSSFASVEEFLS
jgi:hypothetical protein